jgi:hypothetical protein
LFGLKKGKATQKKRHNKKRHTTLNTQAHFETAANLKNLKKNHFLITTRTFTTLTQEASSKCMRFYPSFFYVQLQLLTTRARLQLVTNRTLINL